MARGINTNSDPRRRVDRHRFTDPSPASNWAWNDEEPERVPAKAGTTSIDRPRAQAGFMGWMEAHRIPRHVTQNANNWPGPAEYTGHAAGPYRRPQR